MYDLIIIGSGPAGLSAAIYGKRAGLDLLVLEQNPMSGGQVLNRHYQCDTGCFSSAEHSYFKHTDSSRIWHGL